MQAVPLTEGLGLGEHIGNRTIDSKKNAESLLLEAADSGELKSRRELVQCARIRGNSRRQL